MTMLSDIAGKSGLSDRVNAIGLSPSHLFERKVQQGFSRFHSLLNVKEQGPWQR